MKKVIVHVERAKHNFSAYIEALPGCVTAGGSVEELGRNMHEAITEHIKVSQEYKESVPKIFLGKFELVFKYETSALLEQFGKIFTKAALERITGINQRQLWHYASGEKKPREKQKKRIEEGLHKLGKELLSIEL